MPRTGAARDRRDEAASCVAADDPSSSTDETLSADNADFGQTPAELVADETHPAAPGDRRRALSADDAALTPRVAIGALGPQDDVAPGLLGIADELRRGESVGRFTILRTLGAGGMGVVYAAYDPELDRNIALKLIRGSTSEAAEARLYREAQALAKLSHPNVVAVHDVGTYGGQVWLAMEFVVGKTLSAWRAEAQPSWKPVLEVIKQAARGVAAAHAAGLLHRDLKPDNIMLGSDGRVRVMDFGLARSRRSDDPEPTQSQTAGALGIELTLAGSLMGTPAYMAPEQFAGLPADAQSDQFSLCATLWEALYGERPFGGSTLAELATAVTMDERRRAPTGAGVPGWVRRVAERGLDGKPDRRFPSVDALLAALEADPRPRRWAIGLSAAAVLLVATTAAVLHVQHARALAACAEAATEIDDVWNGAAREAMREGLEGTGVPYAAAAGERALPWLDEYAAAWGQAREELCLAQTVQRRWDDATLPGDSGDEPGDATPPGGALAERAAACMQEGRDQFEFLIDQLTAPRAGAEGAVVVQAVRAASELPPPSQCIDEGLLRLRQRPPTREEARRLRKLLARAATLESIGDYKEGLALAEEVQRGADALGDGALRAAAALGRSQLHDKLGDYETARLAAEEAFLLAGAAGADAIAADAAGQRAWIVGLRQAQHAEGLLWGRLEATHLERAGIPASDVRWARHLNNVGAVHFVDGSLDEAKERYERALTLREAALGPEHPDVANTLNNLGNVYGSAGSFAEAEACFKRTLEIRKKALGPEHPDVATSLNNLGSVAKGIGAHEEAEAYFMQALELRERALGEDHPNVASALDNLGDSYAERGAHEEARQRYARALGIRVAALGEQHPSVADTLFRLGSAYAAEGAAEWAQPHLERALRIYEQTRGGHHLDVASCLHALADVGLDRGRPEEAKARFERALELREKLLGADHPDVAASLVGLADALRTQGEHEAARVRYARAVAIYGAAYTADDKADDRAEDKPTDAGLARALTGLDAANLALAENDAARPPRPLKPRRGPRGPSDGA